MDMSNPSAEQVSLDGLSVGDKLPDLVKDPISRTQLALFAGASGDHNPIHLDDEEARAGGLDGVIAHGMLNMAFLGDYLTRLAEPRKVRSLDARFVAMAFPGDVITCTGEVAGREEGSVELKIAAVNQKGEKVVEGTARVELG